MSPRYNEPPTAGEMADEAMRAELGEPVNEAIWLNVAALTNEEVQQFYQVLRGRRQKGKPWEDAARAILARLAAEQPPQAPARGDAPSVDEIRRRLAVYAVSIDGFDSLNPETQELLTTCAEWVDRELAAQPPARPTVPWPHQPHCNLTLRRRGEGELFDCTCVPDEARPTEPSALMRNGLTQIQELAEAAHNYLSCEINVGVTDEMKRQACQRLASLAGPHSVAYSSAPLAPPPPPETP